MFYITHDTQKKKNTQTDCFSTKDINFLDSNLFNTFSCKRSQRTDFYYFLFSSYNLFVNKSKIMNLCVLWLRDWTRFFNLIVLNFCLKSIFNVVSVCRLFRRIVSTSACKNSLSKLTTIIIKLQFWVTGDKCLSFRLWLTTFYQFFFSRT